MKHEMRNFLLVSGLFTAVFLFTLIFAWPSLSYMAANWPVLFIIGLIQALLGSYSWYMALKNFEDIAYDYWRVVLLVSFGIAIVIFGGFRAQYKLDKADNITIEQPK